MEANVKVKRRIIAHNDGRTCWPEVLLYKYSKDPEGTYHAVPPLDNQAYRLVIFNQLAYMGLFSTGALQSHEHTGRVSKCIDNRRRGRG